MPPQGWPKPPPSDRNKKAPKLPDGSAPVRPPPPPPRPPPAASEAKTPPAPDPRVAAELEAMHEFWCDSERAATSLCVEVAQRRAALQAGEAPPPPGERDAANREEVARMHGAFCFAEAHKDLHPCRMWARKAERERRKKLRRRGGKPEFMEL
jgi:hypothetical protein